MKYFEEMIWGENIAISEKIKENGLTKLVDHYREQFDIDENIRHYSVSDFQLARRQFVKYLLKTRSI